MWRAVRRAAVDPKRQTVIRIPVESALAGTQVQLFQRGNACFGALLVLGPRSSRDSDRADNRPVQKNGNSTLRWDNATET